METNLINKFDIVVDRLNEIITNSDKANKEFTKELDTEIKDLEEIYNDLKEYVDLVKRSKAFKSISELYTNLIGIKKLIIELKEKKFKINENDIKLLKSTSELLYKINQSTIDKENDSNEEIDIIKLMQKINSVS